MKYYDDDYDAEEAYPTKDETVRRPEIQLESLRGLDWLITLILAGVTGGLLTLWSFPGLYPDAWEDAAIGAGLRPMKDIFPGFWNALARGLYSLAGVSTGTFLLKILGRIMAGVTVGLVYLLLRQILSITIRVRLQFSRRRFFVVRGVALLGALCFACSDPVWRAGQAFTPPLMLLFLTVLVLTLFFGFLMSGGMGQIYFSMFLLGLLSAETPMGFFLLALVWGVFLLALRHGAVAANSPILNPVVEQSSKWHLTFLYAIGLVIGVGVNCTTFILFDGLKVFAKVGADVPVMYVTQWWTQFIGAASVMGWVLGLGIGVLPFIVSAVLLPRAVDEEQFLPYHMGAVFFVAGAAAFAQLAELPQLWFWTWVTIKSSYFLLILMLFSAASVVFALAVMAVDICCRDHRRLAIQRFAELKEETDAGTEADAVETRDVKPLGTGARVLLVVVPVLLLAGVLPGRQQSQTRRILAIIDDYAQEVLAECGDVKWIFTDGSFDPLLELSAASKGKSLRALSMMAGNTPRERYIRVPADTNGYEYVVLSSDTPTALRTWVHDYTNHLSDVALQLGFELWTDKDKKVPPPCSGVLARPGGMQEADRLRGVDVATALADRISNIRNEGKISEGAGVRVKELFSFVQWRISRIARIRAIREDRAGNIELAKEYTALSDRLDAQNETYQRIMRDVKARRDRTLGAVSPGETLQQALVRADFIQALYPAEQILKEYPDDPNANFAVGMSYFTQNQWTRSEDYLRKCLIRKPNEPAVLNNLAMICLYTGRYNEGLKLANKALARMVEKGRDPHDVEDTIKSLKEKLAEEGAKETNGQTPKANGKSATDPKANGKSAANPKANSKPSAKPKPKTDNKMSAKSKTDNKAAEKPKTGNKVAAKPKTDNKATANSKAAETSKPDGGQKDKPASESKKPAGKQPPKEGEGRPEDELDALATTPVMLDGHMPSTSADSDSKTK